MQLKTHFVTVLFGGHNEEINFTYNSLHEGLKFNTQEECVTACEKKLESEEGLQEVASELKAGGCRIIDAIEIGSCRDVQIKPEYTVDDFSV